MPLILPTNYTGSVEYFSWIVSSQEIIIESCEYFEKQTLRNRCYIAAANGILPLIVPVKYSREGKKIIRDVRISYDHNWQELHWKSIESAYRSSPYFEFYEDSLVGMYSDKFSFLFDFNETFRTILSGLLGIDNKVKFTTVWERDYPVASDMRNNFNRYDPVKAALPYPQVFESRHGFIPNLSVLDLLFNVGKEAGVYLKSPGKEFRN
ncbi:MAG: WbqC family protein [Bacteroidetes bacterium]|nr:WbqC family protein [Bacteroidota bacterium]